MKKSGCIVPRDELLEALWDDTDFVDDNTLSVNVTRVRKRLEDIGIYNAIETKEVRATALRMYGRTKHEKTVSYECKNIFKG